MLKNNIKFNELVRRGLSLVLVLVMIIGQVAYTSNQNKVSAIDTTSTQATSTASGYEIVNNSNNAITVTIKHMLNAQEIYSQDTKRLEGYGDKINNYKKAVNYEVVSVNVGNETYGSSDKWSKIELTSNAAIVVNYKEITKTSEKNPVAFYDYDVQPNGNELNGSINRNDNYVNTGSKDRFTVGQENQNYFQVWKNYRFQYENYNSNNTYKGSSNSNRDTAKNSSWQYINRYGGEQNAGGDGNKNIVKGIINGIDTNNKVISNYAFPDLFSDNACTGKTVYNKGEYNLSFNQVGDTYELHNVKNNSGTIVTSTVAGGGNVDEFLPMPEDKSKENGRVGGAFEHNKANFFFGMRYSVDFRLDDYTGPLNYRFTGDDDLWVVLDNTNVVLDLGGIHSAVDGSVDLWQILLGKNNYTEADKSNLSSEAKEQVHTLTILYMERGAYDSNCEMKFTLPNAQVVNTSSAPKADITINKVSSVNTDEKLKGAQFKLENSESAYSQTITTNDKGEVKFNNLVAGEYTLTEISAPDRYQIDKKTYKVIVTNNADNKTATATLYAEDGTTLIEGNKITNTPNSEIIKNTLEYNKTAHLTNWDKRTYEIDITAQSKKENTSTSTSVAPIDVMMVFDLSGSMNGSNSGGTSPSLNELGAYKNIFGTLDTKKLYYYGNDTESPAVSGYNYRYPTLPMAYRNNKWQYYSFSTKSWIEIANTDGKKIYTWASRITGLKEASASFINSMSSLSPESKIGLATFYGYKDSKNNYTKGELVRSISTLNGTESSFVDSINQMKADGGTSPQYGLALAKTELDKLKKDGDTNKKYVILFSDGDPSETEDKTASVSQANLLKNEGYTVITIGFGVTSNTEKWLKDSIASKKDDGTSYAYTANDSSSLTDIFQQIQTSITTGSSYTGVNVVDTISREFELTQEQKDAFDKDDNVSYVINDDGTTTITWTNQTIPYDTNHTDWWRKVINVVAKDEYIGGNDVATNVAGANKSYIELPELGKAALQQPKVNVKVDFKVDNVDDVLFKGEIASVDDINNLIDKMFNNALVKSSNGTVITIYDKDKFTIDRKLNNFANGVNFDSTTKSGDITVTYDPGTIDAGSDANVNSTINNEVYDATRNNENIKSGTWKLDFVAGQLAITKVIDQQYISNNIANKINSDQTFIFKIEQYAVNNDDSKGDKVRTFYQTISFDASQNVSTQTKYISELEKGYYTVTEETAWSTKYKLNATADNFEFSTAQEGQDMFIGKLGESVNNKKTYYGLETKHGDSNNYYNSLANGSEATVTFTNGLQSWNKWYSDTGFARNTFK